MGADMQVQFEVGGVDVRITFGGWKTKSFDPCFCTLFQGFEM